MEAGIPGKVWEWGELCSGGTTISAAAKATRALLLPCFYFVVFAGRNLFLKDLFQVFIQDNSVEPLGEEVGLDFGCFPS